MIGATVYYEYIGYNCPNADKCEHAQIKGKTALCHHTIQMPAAKMQEIGKKRKCPIKGCNHKVTRVVSSNVQISIKGATFTPGNGTRVRTRVGGKDLDMEFIDHKHTDVDFQKKMNEVSRMGGINAKRNALSHAYRNKDGRLVVDVASNIPDPLGAIERDKRKGDYQKTTHKINTPTRRRGNRS